MQIDIVANESVQEQINSSQVGDTLTFSGVFYLDEPLVFWTNRDYYGAGSIFYVKRGGIECRNRPGEREKANKIAQWLHEHLSVHAHAEPLSFDIDEDTTIFYQGELIVENGEILGTIPKTPWYFYPKRWLARQLLRIVHHLFWFPRGGIITGFSIHGSGQGVGIRA